MNHTSFYKIILFTLIVLPSANLSAEFTNPKYANANSSREDQRTLVGDRNFLSGYEPMNIDGTVNAIIEIPAGTTAKWEVSKETGNLMWEDRDGKPRIVNYLGYPGNYGMIPKSLLPKSLGGDGDPLDVLVLGPGVPRGQVIPVKIIGILHLLDRGETDDKLIAVMAGTRLFKVDSLKELNKKYKGVTKIIETWFSNYKGPNKMKSLGFGGNKSARKMLESAILAYSKAEKSKASN